MQLGFMRLIVFLLLSFHLLIALCSQSALIGQHHLSISPQAIELSFILNKPIHFKQFSLTQPPRLVIDMSNATITRRPSLNLQHTPIKQLRWGHQANGNLRVVFDLKRPIHAIVHQRVNPPYQLVIRFKQPMVKTTKPVTVKPARPVIIVVDPGHGGKDPGATGRHGTHEKVVVLSIAKQLVNFLNHEPGFKAYLTRKSDYYITLRQRLAIARRYHADMFVSIHADAYHNPRSHGASVFALSRRGATSEAARWLAQRENESEFLGGVSLNNKSHLLRSVLIDLSQNATIRSSLQIGSSIINRLRQVSQLHHQRVEQAAFVVLKSPDIPSLLVETGFLSNRQEEHRLRQPHYRRQVAIAIMQGIKHYFTNQPPRDTMLAKKRVKHRAYPQAR